MRCMFSQTSFCCGCITTGGALSRWSSNFSILIFVIVQSIFCSSGKYQSAVEGGAMSGHLSRNGNAKPSVNK
eukprot:12841684-Heterocapsa_arctica.AAC.1